VGLTQRRFTREFKLEALRQLAGGKSFARLARELELHENVLRRWQLEYEKEPGVRFREKARGGCGSTGRPSWSARSDR
jgi:transposase